jgi:hypothetical protein
MRLGHVKQHVLNGIKCSSSVREKRIVDCSNRIVNVVGVERWLLEPKSKLADALNSRLPACLPPEQINMFLYMAGAVCYCERRKDGYRENILFALWGP